MLCFDDVCVYDSFALGAASMQCHMKGQRHLFATFSNYYQKKKDFNEQSAFLMQDQTIPTGQVD